MPKFFLILLNWNNAPDTLECLSSLEKLDYPHYEILLIDNGSTDSSLKVIREAYPDLRILEMGENRGFSDGCNRGLKEGLKGDADFFLLLNNDTVVAPNLLTAIAKAAENRPEVGVFGPKIYYYGEPATIWYAGGGVDPQTGRCFHIGCGASDDNEKYKDEALTDYVCGCALAVRREVVERVGGLDPKFFLLWEEIDWCYRIRDKGYSSLYVPSARIWHKISSSFPEGNRGPMWRYFYSRNRLLFHRRHTPRFKRWQKGGLFEKPLSIVGTCDYFLGRFGKGRLSKFTQ
ncbi:MAG: N-acetylglucosaminyl-diphospho-decaprenol L-rhamnosyltransferase [Chlamydiae bacterium]|nr:N-acetylglucosaminyl-diphospho-decaprenol L-rhamnosyltransferase [Chlamydiota bacterium]